MMKKDMADSVSMTWQLLCDEHGFTRALQSAEEVQPGDIT